MKKGKVQFIEPDGMFKDLTKNKVTLADGQQFTFFSKGNFKANVGDEIDYEVTNAQYGNAKLVQQQQNFSKPSFGGGMGKDHQIIRQTCIKASSEFNAQKGGVTIQDVINDAERLLNWVNNG